MPFMSYDRQHVAGRVLELVPLARVNERRRVRQELGVDHEVVEGARDLVDDRGAFAPALLPLGYGDGYPPAHLLGGLLHPVPLAGEVALAPRLEEVFTHLYRFDPRALPEAEALLFRVVLGLTEASQAVEIFGQPRVPYAPFPHSVKMEWAGYEPH